jgi:hypothetical protein
VQGKTEDPTADQHLLIQTALENAMGSMTRATSTWTKEWLFVQDIENIVEELRYRCGDAKRYQRWLLDIRNLGVANERALVRLARVFFPIRVQDGCKLECDRFSIVDENLFDL